MSDYFFLNFGSLSVRQDINHNKQSLDSLCVRSSSRWTLNSSLFPYHHWMESMGSALPRKEWEKQCWMLMMATKDYFDCCVVKSCCPGVPTCWWWRAGYWRVLWHQITSRFLGCDVPSDHSTGSLGYFWTVTLPLAVSSRMLEAPTLVFAWIPKYHCPVTSSGFFLLSHEWSKKHWN